MTRRCSHCSNNGHNSRTCPTRGGIKLFGVRLMEGSIKKSASVGSLSSAHYCSSSSAAASPNPGSPSSDHLRDPTPVADGYASDDPAHTTCSSTCRAERKKGVPWTEEEHRLFLMGLQKLGKGDWRGIARNYVTSRTPTQVASHAQKHFIRQSNATRRKRRASLFDMVPDMALDPPEISEEYYLPPSYMHGEIDNVNQIPTLSLSLQLKDEPMEPISNITRTEAEETVSSRNFTQIIPALFPTYQPVPVPLPFWSPNLAMAGEGKEKEISSQHQVLRPIPVLPKDPVNVDELVGISQLSLGEHAVGHTEASPLSLELLGAPSRQSAFQANTPAGGSDLSKGSNSAIHAI